MAPRGANFEELVPEALRVAGAASAELYYGTDRAVLWTKTHDHWLQGSYEGDEVEELPGKIEAVLELFAPGSFIEVLDAVHLTFFRFDRDEYGVYVRRWCPLGSLAQPVPYGPEDVPEWHTFL